MTTRTLTAMFKTRAEAERAGQMLVSDLHLQQAMVRVSPGTGIDDTGYDAAHPYEEKGFFGALKDMFLPDEDRFAYAEGMRRGGVLLTATVDDAQVDKASDVIEHAGALDLDQQEQSWKSTGWKGYDSTARTSVAPAVGAAVAGAAATAKSAVTGTATAVTGDDTIKVMEERLVVGKRAVEAGRVKVRAYTIERPVEEKVSLHEERVTIDRRPVDRVATAADLAAFGEKTIEARATSEEAVVGKEARVIEEIGVNKSASDRTETVRDTVRKTQVDVEDTTATVKTGGVTGTTGVKTETGVAGAIDRTLGTNLSGKNP